MLYRLISGKIHRLNADGVMEKHTAPYDFVPTDAELEANKWRMKLISNEPVKAVEVAVPAVKKDTRWNATPPELIPANIPADTRLLDPADNICLIGSVAAIKYITAVESVDLLNALETQELANTLKTPRTSVLKAIRLRRDYCVFKEEQRSGTVSQ